jgi:hypothetical protein
MSGVGGGALASYRVQNYNPCSYVPFHALISPPMIAEDYLLLAVHSRHVHVGTITYTQFDALK